MLLVIVKAVIPRQIFQLCSIEFYVYVYVLGFLDEVLSPCSISTLGDQGEAYTILSLQKGGSGSCACMFRARQFFVMKLHLKVLYGRQVIRKKFKNDT